MGAPSFDNLPRHCAQVVLMDVNARKAQSGALHRVVPSECAGVRALVLVGGRPESERFGEFPLALLDVLGRSVLMRTLDRIQAAGVAEVMVLSDTDPLPHSRSVSCQFSVADPQCFWDDALQKFRQLSSHSECVLVLRLGAWAEADFAAMVHRHRYSGSAITRAYSPARQALDMFVISSVNQAEAAALLRGELRDERIAAVAYHCDGYVNMLASPADLRALTLDAFAGECEIQPCGRELRPGVWVGKKTHIHRCARVVAPAFIGDFCCVQRDAVVTAQALLSIIPRSIVPP